MPRPEYLLNTMPFLSDSKDTLIRGGTFTDISGNNNHWDNSYRAYNSHNKHWTGASPNRGNLSKMSTSGTPPFPGAQRGSSLAPGRHSINKPNHNTPNSSIGGDPLNMISPENIQILLPDLDDETVRLLKERGFFEHFNRKPETPACPAQPERNPWGQTTRPSEQAASPPLPGLNPGTNPSQYKSNNPFRALLSARNLRTQAP